LNSSAIWTSAKRPEGGKSREFYWTNSGDPMTYRYWRPTQPFRGSDTADCVAMSKSYSYR